MTYYTTSSSNTWQTWASTDSTATWDQWTDTTATTTSSGSDITWTAWARADYFCVESISQRAREQSKQLDKEKARKRRVANLKAMRLLRKVVTDEQWAQLKEKGFFEVIGRSGKKYELHKHTTVSNVIQVDFKQRQKMCAHPDLHMDGGTLPMADVLVAQKLAIEHREDEFLAVANLD